MPEPDKKPDRPDEREEQPYVGTDPMRAPQNRKERKIVAPDPDEVKKDRRTD